MAKRQQVGDFNPYKAIQPSQQVTDQYITPSYFQAPQNEMIDIARSLSGLSETMSEITGNMQRAEVEAEIQQGTAQVDVMSEEQLDAALSLQWRQAGLPEGASPIAQKAILAHAGSKKARQALEQFRISNLDRFADPYSTEDPRAAMQQAFDELGITGFYAGNAATAEFSKQANAFSEQVYQARAARTSQQLREDLTDNLAEALKAWRTDKEGAFARVRELVDTAHTNHGIAGDKQLWDAFKNIYLDARSDQDPLAAESLLDEFVNIKVGSATMGKRYASELFDLENAGDRHEEAANRKEEADRIRAIREATDVTSIFLYENREDLENMAADAVQDAVQQHLEEYKDENGNPLIQVAKSKAMEDFDLIYRKITSPSRDITDKASYDALFNATIRGEITAKEALKQSLSIPMSTEDLRRLNTAIGQLEGDETNNRLRPVQRRRELDAQGLNLLLEDSRLELQIALSRQGIPLNDLTDQRAEAASRLKIDFNAALEKKTASLISKHWNDEESIDVILENIREELDPWVTDQIGTRTEGPQAPARIGAMPSDKAPKLSEVPLVAEGVAAETSVWSDTPFPDAAEELVDTFRDLKADQEDRQKSFANMEQASSDRLAIFRTPTATNPSGVLDYTFRSDGIHKSVKELLITGPGSRDFKYITKESPQPDENLTKHYFVARSFAEPLTVEELKEGVTTDGIQIPADVKDPRRFLFVNNQADLEAMAVEYKAAETAKTPLEETRVGELLIALGVKAGDAKTFFMYQSLQLGIKPSDLEGSN